MIAHKLEAIRMRPVSGAADSSRATRILLGYVGDEPWKLDELIPGGTTFIDVEIAVDGSAALFEVYGGIEWSDTKAPSLGRVFIQQTSGPEEPESEDDPS